MQLPDFLKITTDSIQLPFLQQKGISVEMLRLDKIHPVISGNKWFKLKYHLQNFSDKDYHGILTFGGAWSNHILATACACQLKGIKSTGIIRGEKPLQLSYTLQQAELYGMQLSFIPRETYKRKSEKELSEEIIKKYPNYYIIQEGGAGAEGEKGAGEIIQLFNKNKYTHILCAIGTSTMFNGILSASRTNQQIIGIPVIKGINERKMKDSGKIFNNYHFGGYAKYTPELIQFMNNFYRQTNIPTDFVYTGKLSFALFDLLKKDFFPKESKILIIHSGGLQGNISLPQGTLIF